MMAPLRQAQSFLRSLIKSPYKALLELYGYFWFLITGYMFKRLMDCPDVAVIRLEIPGIPFPFNPSVTNHPDGWLFSFRVTRTLDKKIDNCQKNDDRYSKYSINYTILYNENFSILEKNIIDIPADATSEEKIAKFAPNGVSDLRPFYCADRLFFLGYASDLVSHCDTMVLCEFKDGKVTDLDFVQSPKNSRIEKNWMPFSPAEENILAIYTINPFVVVSIEDGIARIVSEKILTNIPRDYRGSSQVVPYRDGFICVAHRVIQNAYRNIYLHRFFFYDNSWNLTETSGDFVLEKAGVEFCAGLAINNDMCLVTYGVDDKHARAMRFSCLILDKMLRPIPASCSQSDEATKLEI